MKTWLWIAISVVTLIMGFGVGVLTGRNFPIHHYERMGESWNLLDTTTGKVCDLRKNANPTNIFDANPVKDANGLPIVAPSYPPPCPQ
jgi:hypothetical protein